MAIPDTATGWGLTDVRMELGLGATASLTDCFSAAEPSDFDPAYEGSKDRLSNFRNYGAGAPTTPIMLGRDAGTPSTACTIGTVQYYIPSGQTWGTATAIYEDSDGTILAPGGYYYSNGSTYRRWEGGTLSPQTSCP